MTALIRRLEQQAKYRTISAPNAAEIELVNGIKTGCKSSIEKLYHMYAEALYGVISRIVKFDEIAEDVLQDTFVKIWKNIDQYDPSRGRLFTWMVNMAKNLAIDQIRSKSYVMANKTDDMSDVSSETLDKGNHIHFNADLIGLKQLTSNLKPEHKIVLDLFYFEGLTHVEVSEQLNMPLGTVKTKIRQAILQLRRLFNETSLGLSSIA